MMNMAHNGKGEFMRERKSGRREREFPFLLQLLSWNHIPWKLGKVKKKEKKKRKNGTTNENHVTSVSTDLMLRTEGKKENLFGALGHTMSNIILYCKLKHIQNHITYLDQ